MYSYPWTNMKKKLDDIKSGDLTPVRVDDMHQWFEDIKNRHVPWYESMWYSVERNFHDVVWSIYRWFVPCHQSVRQAVPRKWMDCTQLILDVNFAIIKEFVEHEMNNVTWDDESRPMVKEAGEWLRASYVYITKHRSELQQQYDEALASASDVPFEQRRTMTYTQLYGESNRIEQEIDDRDQQVLMGLAKHRQWMWT